MLNPEIRSDDLSGAATLALIARHLQGMHAESPPESVHALDVGELPRAKQGARSAPSG